MKFLQSNNQSKLTCKSVSNHLGFKKESYRNAIIDTKGNKFSFATSSSKMECRQCYSDTKGFYLVRGRALYMWTGNVSSYPVSRISPSGVKAHNVVVSSDDKKFKFVSLILY